MPGRRGRHQWRGGRGLQRGQIARFVEPCLLTLLLEGSRHGYDLIAGLEKFGLESDMLDSGLIYRVLRQMEDAGWVVSQWETGNRGPARRVYSLTSTGREALLAWRNELGRTHDILHRLLASQPNDFKR